MALAVRRGPVKHPRRRQRAVGRSRQFERHRERLRQEDSIGVGVGAAGTASDPKPVNALEQLVTLVTVLAFVLDAKVLSIASRGKRDALRMGMKFPPPRPRRLPSLTDV